MLAKYAADDLKQTAFSHEMFASTLRAKRFRNEKKITRPIVEQLSHRPKNRLIKKALRCFCFPNHELSLLTKAFMIIVVWCLIDLCELVA